MISRRGFIGAGILGLMGAALGVALPVEKPKPKKKIYYAIHSVDISHMKEPPVGFMEHGIAIIDNPRILDAVF